jgi:hypothetical protein
MSAPCGWHRPGVLAAWRAWRHTHPAWAAAHAVAASLAGGCAVVAISAPHAPAAALRAPAAPVAVPEPGSLAVLGVWLAALLLALYFIHRRTRA